MSSKCTLITPKLLKQQPNISLCNNTWFSNWIFYYQMLVSINNYYTKIQKVLTKYQSVERVTLFLLVGSFDLRTGHLAIL